MKLSAPIKLLCRLTVKCSEIANCGNTQNVSSHIMKSWKVKYSGKLDIQIFSYTVIILAYLLLILRATEKEGGDLFENLWMGLIILFPFLVAAISVPASMLKNKLIPKSIEIDPGKQIIDFTFFKNHSPLQVELKDLSYQEIESTFITILVFYKTEIATRGHLLHVELFNIISLDISTSWKKRQVYEIVLTPY